MIQPAFSLDFTTAVADPRVSFSRAGNTATRFNSSGLIEVVNADTQRFDFNPLTLACKGLLVEEARTNLLSYSSEFNNAYWNKVGTVTGDAGIAPDGNMTADKLAAGTSNNISKGVTTVAGVTYTGTVFIKSANVGQSASLRLNLSYGTATPVVSLPINTTDSWTRYSVTFTAVNTLTFFQIGEWAAFGYGPTNDILVYGAQVEVGSEATSYIPTTTTAVTRNADVATITGTNFSDFWQASKGGAQVQAIPSTVSGIRPLVQYDDGTANNIIALRGNAANPELQVVDGGAPQVQLDAGTIVANTPYSLTGWWSTNDCKARQNSGATVSDYTATIPTVTQARLGSDGTNYLNGHLATINYYTSFLGQSIYTRRKNKVIFSLL